MLVGDGGGDCDEHGTDDMALMNGDSNDGRDGDGYDDVDDADGAVYDDESDGG